MCISMIASGLDLDSLFSNSHGFPFGGDLPWFGITGSFILDNQLTSTAPCRFFRIFGSLGDPLACESYIESRGSGS